MAKKVLLVIEMQNDYLWEKRKQKFPYDTETLVSAVNSAIAEAEAAGTDVICLMQVFPDTPTNHLVFGFCIEQTEGVKLYAGLHAEHAKQIEKNTADPYLSAEFAKYVSAQGYDEFLLCGIDEYGSISGAAKAIAQHGAAVTILKACTATRFPANKLIPVRNELKQLGVIYK
ncbi:MAG: isochorismatase family protein [Oscillospiraceae bacterium]|nr:isochorismatase family protein [Oscillospiraceae bacterium]